MIVVYRKTDGEIVSLSTEENINLFYQDQFDYLPEEYEFEITNTAGETRKEKITGFGNNLVNQKQIKVHNPISDNFDIIKITDKSVKDYLDTIGPIYDLKIESPKLNDGSTVNILAFVEKVPRVDPDTNEVVTAEFYTSQDKAKYKSKVYQDAELLANLDMVSIMQTKKVNIKTKRLVDKEE